MKDRDLIAQMAASICPHIRDYHTTKSKEYLAVDLAMSILAEVDARAAQVKTKKQRAESLNGAA
jgi:hypothetical protein